MLEYVIVQLQEIYFYPFLFFYRPVFQGPFSFWSWIVFMCIIHLEFNTKENTIMFFFKFVVLIHLLYFDLGLEVDTFVYKFKKLVYKCTTHMSVNNNICH